MSRERIKNDKLDGVLGEDATISRQLD